MICLSVTGVCEMAMYDIYVSVYDVTDIYMSVTCACQDQLSVCDMYV